jgi:hypothetical protein
MSRYVVFLFFFLLPCMGITQSVSTAALDFLNSLSSELRSQASFPFNSNERFNMNFVPMVRKGPTFHDFNPKQKDAALALLNLCLSQKGYSKTIDIMDLERVLNIIEGQSRLSDGKLRRDPLNYHFCFFGNPTDKHWAWRFEGHHVSLNFVFENSTMISSTPFFFGSNPAIVRETDQRGKQVLKLEMDLGFKLINSMDGNQLTIARFSEEAPYDIVTRNDRHPDVPGITGISYKQMNDAQRKIFMDLLNVYIDNYQLGFSKTLRAKIERTGIDNLHFAWAGSLKPGSGQYYRIQGPMLIIEYDNVQNNANHIHSVVRDLTNDYAEDILREHYRKEH